MVCTYCHGHYTLHIKKVSDRFRNKFTSIQDIFHYTISERYLITEGNLLPFLSPEVRSLNLSEGLKILQILQMVNVLGT